MGGLAIVAIALHGRLAQDRPVAAHLTEFYLVQSVGGVLGGAFVALVAPLVFPGVWEYPILLTGALVALAATVPAAARAASAAATAGRRRFVLSPFLAGARARSSRTSRSAAVVVAVMLVEQPIALPIALRWIGVGAAILVVGGPPGLPRRRHGPDPRRRRPRHPEHHPEPRRELQARSFFGVTAVIEDRRATIRGAS